MARSDGLSSRDFMKLFSEGLGAIILAGCGLGGAGAAVRHRLIFIMLLAIALLAGTASSALANFTVDAGETYTMAAGETLTVDGNLTIASTSILDSSATSGTISLTGDWTNNGTFIAGTSSTVVFGGTSGQNVLGSAGTTFFNLTATTVTAGAARTLGFEAGRTQVAGGLATLQGAAGRVLSLRTVTSAALLRTGDPKSVLDFTGTTALDYLDLRDIEASSGNAAITLPVSPTNSLNSGNTTNWFDDTDGDGISDVTELDAGTDPIDATDNDTVAKQVQTIFAASDSTADGAPAASDLSNTSTGGALFAGVNAARITLYETGINNPVSAGLLEYANTSAPTRAEVQAVIDAVNALVDTDGDGIADVTETDAGTNPNDSTDNDTSAEKLQTIVNASDATADGAPIASDLTNSSLTNVVPPSMALYEVAFHDPTSVSLPVFSAPPTLAEVQAVIDAVNTTADADGDGVSNAVELAGFNSGDGNGDTFSDAAQKSVTGLPNPATPGLYATLVSTGGCSAITEMTVELESAQSVEDPLHDFPMGLLGFQLQCANPGDSANVTIFYTQVYDTSGWTTIKFNPNTSAYTDITDIVSVTVTPLSVGGTPVTTISYALTDGGALDTDRLANGAISDPVGPGVTITGEITLTKTANKKKVSVGDVVTYTVTAVNTSTSNLADMVIADNIPAGFKYIKGRTILDGMPVADPTGVRTRWLNFDIDSIASGVTRTLKYQLVVGSGVSFGNYQNVALASTSTSFELSNRATATVEVVPDPLFDQSTIIGKVFNDRNENGIQDEGEEPVPNVRIVTAEGTVITTGRDGMYHLAGIVPGRHLLRLDERTLPGGAYLTTDKVVIADVTPGLLAKVNFGVKAPDGGQLQSGGVNIVRGMEMPTPRLNVAHYVLDAGRPRVEEPGAHGLRPSAADLYEFRVFTNYQLFIERWSIEIRDKSTNRLVKTLEGTGNNISEPTYWDGKDEGGRQTKADRGYVYMVKVAGADGGEDVSGQRNLSAVNNDSQRTGAGAEKSADGDGGDGYAEWLRRERAINSLDKQTIRIEGEAIRVVGSNYRSIRVLKGQRYIAEIAVIGTEGLRAKDLAENPGIEAQGNQSDTEIIMPRGEYAIEVQGSEPTISGRSSTDEGRSSAVGDGLGAGDVFRKNITIGDDYFFFVAMGDAKVGYTSNRGNIAPVHHDDEFQKGFSSEGQLAYYLKGKILGKYLITSSLDTERDKKELFRNLDPDKYYPVYGDSSSVDYEATDTQGVLYLLIEWDKSSALWGNYNTALTDTEFAQFSRTLYGGMVDFESTSTTRFGEPDTKLIIFSAEAQQRAAHNEFTGTGGSLYYLKHKDVVEGSDKVRVEVRDKITGLVLSMEEMDESSDYEIDYSNGRIVFFNSISSTSESSSIVSAHLLDGNPVYVVVDYEYEAEDDYDKGTVGGRVQQSITDYVSLGATYVEEKQAKQTYQLEGVDAVVHLGKNVKLTAAYAESESEAMGSFISTDGGLSFTELPTAGSSKGRAYGVKGQAYLLKDKLGLAGYYKWIDNDFSTSATSSQQGKELIGFNVTLDISPKTRLTASHDIQRLIDDGNPQTRLQVGATGTETTSAQITHMGDRLKLTGEYRHQEVTGKIDEFESETNREEDAVAVKAEYELTEKVDVFLEQQVTLKGKKNHQTTVGIEAEVNDWMSLRAKETVGSDDAATSVGVIAGLKDRFEVSGDYTRSNDRAREAGDRISLGANAKINEKTEVHSTYAVTNSMDEGRVQSLTFGSKRKINDRSEATVDTVYASSRDTVLRSNIFGLSGDINDKWAASATYERGVVRNLDSTQTKRNAIAIGLGFVDKDTATGELKMRASSKLELRLDDGQENKRQYLLYNAIEGKINPDTTLFANINLSQTRNTTTDSIEAEFKELIFGTAYRPIQKDWLNLLAKYSYLEDRSPASQSDINDIEEEKAHVLAVEAVTDLTDKWQLSEKLAYKIGKERVTGFDFTKTSTWLWINRLGYNINRDWQVFGEYRVLAQKQAEDKKHGVLVEIARNVGDFLQVGVGYNFTKFNDDLTSLDYTSQGPFIRVTGKFYDRSPAEKRRRRQRTLERKKVRREAESRKELERQSNDEISSLYKEAMSFYEQDRFDKATAVLEQILSIDPNHREARKHLERIRSSILQAGFCPGTPMLTCQN